MELLTTKNLTKRFGGLTAVKDVTFSLEKGEIIGLIGPNGAGKTTLINLISGAFAPTEGSIVFDGNPVTGKNEHTINTMGIARTFQVVRIFKQLTVLENVLVALVDRSKYGPWQLVWNALTLKSYDCHRDVDACRQADELLELVGLTKFRNETADNLPYALTKRLEIARALATRPKLLLLDEPSSGLNPKEQNEQITLIKDINARGISILIIEHVMRIIMDISHRLIVLHYGQLIAQGNPEAVYSDPSVVEAYLGGDSYANH